MTTLFTDIKLLVGTQDPKQVLRGKELANLPTIEHAYLLVEDGVITAFGAMMDLEWQLPHRPNSVYSVSGQMVLPAWCDSHTHIVFAGSRESEFVDKLNGLSYAEIAAKGGGILNSAAKLNETSADDLFDSAMQRLNEIQLMGTGSVEIKSGYGLTVEGELKMLRVIKRLKEKTQMNIKASFLAAHTFPVDFKENHEGYIRMIIDEMLPVIQTEGLADYIDVFCETGFFNPDEMNKIVNAGKEIGLKPKLHVNQLNSIGGIEAGIELDAVSMDHLETLTENEIELLGNYKGCSTLLPTAAYFLRMGFQPARKLINAGAAIVLASDYNPGSSPSGNMNLVNSMSCIQMKMLPEEVINASTINGAFAMEVNENAGSIAVGKRADLIFTKPIPSLPYLFYSFGQNHIDKVMINGHWIEER